MRWDEAVQWIGTNTSEKPGATTFSVLISQHLITSSKQWNTQHCSATSMLTSLQLPHTLVMEEAGCSEILVATCWITWHNSPEGHSLYALYCEKLKIRQWRCLWQPWNCTSGVYSKEAHWTNTTTQTFCRIYIKSWETAVENWFLPIFQFFLFFQ